MHVTLPLRMAPHGSFGDEFLLSSDDVFLRSEIVGSNFWGSTRMDETKNMYLERLSVSSEYLKNTSGDTLKHISDSATTLHNITLLDSLRLLSCALYIPSRSCQP